ncbi:MAG: dihydroneopterin aldolase [Cytophagales bacterium]|nr:dihydroneopterin aldolase [Cytophagales bacterium]MDW8384167.1 dihydroneopterin aldolase [Flammeovirgaceae bacterium]
MGTIQLLGLEFFAYHGFYKEEQKIGNKYGVDVSIHTDLFPAATDDELRKTINYEHIYQMVCEEMEIPARLLEHLAFRIGERILRTYSAVKSVSITVKKFNPPIGGVCQCAAVTLHLPICSKERDKSIMAGD